MYASKSINRRAAAVLAAVFMVCTAFAVLADNSEASAYDDAKAFGDYVNPHAADAPGGFDVEFSGTQEPLSSYNDQTILIRAGAIIDVENVPAVMLTDCKVYFEAGDSIAFRGDPSMFFTYITLNGDCEVVFGYQTGVSNGFTVDIPGDVTLVVSDLGSSVEFNVTASSVEFAGSAVFNIGSTEIAVTHYMSNNAVYTFTDAEHWSFFFPSVHINGTEQMILSLEMKRDGSAYSTKAITGDSGALVSVVLLAPRTVAVPAEGMTVIDGPVSADTVYTAETILVKPGFVPAKDVTLTLQNCKVFFAPGEYDFVNSFNVVMADGDLYGANDLVFGNATVNNVPNSDSEVSFTVPGAKLTVRESGASIDLSGAVTINANGSQLVLRGDSAEDLVLNVTDRYTWDMALNSYEYDSTGSACAAFVCKNGNLTLSREVSFDGTGGHVDVTAQQIADLKDAAAGDAGFKAAFVIDEKYTVTLDSAALSALGTGAATLEVKDVTSDQSALTDKQKEAVGDRPVFAISFGDNTNFGSGTVTVTVPYALKSGESPNGIYVAYVAADGTLEKLPTTYNAEDGTVTFTTTHFSVFTVMTGLTHGSISPAVMAAAALTAAVVAGLVCVVIRSGRY